MPEMGPVAEFECGAEMGEGQRGAELLLFVEAVLASETEPSPAGRLAPGPLATPKQTEEEA